MAKKLTADEANAEALEAADREFIEGRRRLLDFDMKEQRDRARRVAVAARKRRKVLETVAKTTGVSLEQIDALHDADWELVLRQAKAREASAMTLLKRHHAGQRAAMKTVLKQRERFEYQGGNPIFQTCMWRATSAVTFAEVPIFFPNQGTAGLIPPSDSPLPTVGNNLIRFSASARANATGSFDRFEPASGFELLTSHVFVTTARADGILSVTGHFAPLGTVFLGAPGDCYGLGGSASVTLTVFLDVRITPPGAFGFNVPRGDPREILFQRVDAGCDTETRQVLVGPTGGESYTLTNADLAGVQTGDTIRVNARFALRLATALRGNAVAGFLLPPNGLNVPLVVAKIVV